MSGETDDTREQILGATRRALAEHGYADLSMAKIAAEFDGSQSLLHYHFDTKDDLVAAYVRWARERFEARVASLPEDPEARLDALLGLMVDLDLFEGPGAMAAVVEMYGAADENDALRRELRAYDEAGRRALRETVEGGQESGVFADVDAEAVAWLVFAIHESAFLRALAGEDTAPLVAALETFVLSEVRR